MWMYFVVNTKDDNEMIYVVCHKKWKSLSRRWNNSYRSQWCEELGRSWRQCYVVWNLDEWCSSMIKSTGPNLSYTINLVSILCLKSCTSWWYNPHSDDRISYKSVLFSFFIVKFSSPNNIFLWMNYESL